VVDVDDDRPPPSLVVIPFFEVIEMAKPSYMLGELR